MRRTLTPKPPIAARTLLITGLGSRVDWIFQATPKRYDVHAAVAVSRQGWWNTPRYRDQITIKDRVWLQIAGPDAPGIYYTAMVISLAYEAEPESDESPTFGRWRADIRFDSRIDPPLLRTELLNYPGLESFRPFRGFQGSNVPVPPDVASKLSGIAATRLVPLARSRRTRP
jgi:hypothetical protein